MMVCNAAPRLLAASFLILACQVGLHPQLIAADAAPAAGRHALRAGASAIDVSPTSFPVLINGGFLQASATKVNDPLFARCLVLDRSSRAENGESLWRSITYVKFNFRFLATS